MLRKGPVSPPDRLSKDKEMSWLTRVAARRALLALAVAVVPTVVALLAAQPELDPVADVIRAELCVS